MSNVVIQSEHRLLCSVLLHMYLYFLLFCSLFHLFIVILQQHVYITINKTLIEKHIILEDIDPVIFYGINNGHLQMLKSLFPQYRIMARDNVIRILGDGDNMEKIEGSIESMRKHVLKFNAISDEDILDIVTGHQTKADAIKGVIVYNISGKPIKSRSANQQKLIDAFEKSDMIFAEGPA